VAVAEDFDIEASGLLDGLDDRTHAERAELIPWPLQRGVTAEEIRDAFAPMLLAGRLCP
jgi:adenylate cyclase